MLQFFFFFFLQEMGLKIMSNINIRKPRLCLTNQSTTMMKEKGMFTSSPMLMFARPHKESNSKHLTTISSHMDIEKVKAVLNLS